MSHWSLLRWLLFAFVFSVFALGLNAADTPLIVSGSVWKYVDNGTDQGTGWRQLSFNDGSWKSGAAQLGYGDGDEATVVGYGSDPNHRYITTYFRRVFSVADLSAIATLKLQLMRDDGAVIYLNGTEVVRSNMPGGSISYSTLASTAICCTDETALQTFSINPNLLQVGNNVLAVEIHQSGGSSSDISFDLSLTGSSSATVTRGPYLQSATTSSVVVRWRTSTATNGVVHYGTSSSLLTSQATDSEEITEHQVRLTGLLPNTRYYYDVGTTSQVLVGSSSHFFRTSPTSSVSTRIWAIGDSGRDTPNSRAVRDAYLKYTDSRATDVWLMLGDNAYESGTDSEYQTGLFDLYPQVLRNAVLWPSLGNHDTAEQSTITLSLPYLQIFTLPTQAEAGGLPSGTEKYYSYDFGNVHFIALDSMASDYSPSGPMFTWLKNDLAATNKTWAIAYWHHAPYSRGSHDSDVDPKMKLMRQNALPILEEGGVDLVLGGHSHNYERSFLLDGHYGLSSTFTSAYKKNGGSGRVDGSGAYRKPTIGTAPHEGAVYVVAGTAATGGTGAMNHPTTYYSSKALGSLVIDVNGKRLDVKMLRDTGAIADYFTIYKGPAPALPGTPSNLTATVVSSSRIDLRWTDNSNIEEGFELMRSTDGVSFSRVARLNANTAYFANSGLTAGKKYWYRVRAYNLGGKSGYSNTLSASTFF